MADLSYAVLDTEQYLDEQCVTQTEPTLEAGRLDADRVQVRIQWSRIQRTWERGAEFQLGREELERMLAILDAQPA